MVRAAKHVRELIVLKTCLLHPAEALCTRVCVFVHTRLHTSGPSLQPGCSQPEHRRHGRAAAGRDGRFAAGPGREETAGAGLGRAEQLRGVPRAGTGRARGALSPREAPRLLPAPVAAERGGDAAEPRPRRAAGTARPVHFVPLAFNADSDLAR